MEQTFSRSSFSPPQYSEEYSPFLTSMKKSTAGISLCEPLVGNIDQAKGSKKANTTYAVWTNETDEHLRFLVSTYGHTWKHIASLMAQRFPDFTPNTKQCKGRWDNNVRPGLNNGDWSDQELALLRQKYETYGSSWSRYQADFPDRSQKMIQYRCKSFKKNRSSPIGLLRSDDDRLMNCTKRRFDETSIPAEVNPTLKKRKIIWTSERDQFLHSLVLKIGRKWIKIAKEMAKQFDDFSLNGQQCGERWDRYINPKLNKEPWTIEEKALLKEKFKIHGKSWKSYQDDFPGRSQNAIKNIWMSMNRNISKKNSSSVVSAISPQKSMSGDVPPDLLQPSEIISSTPAEQVVSEVEEFDVLSFLV